MNKAWTSTAALCGAWMAGCLPSIEKTFETPPAGITRIAVIELNDDGVVTAATGLVSPDDPVVFGSRGNGPIWVVGYTDADLAQAVLPPQSALQDSRLRIAVGCEAALPVPSWSHAIDTSGAPPPLTAAWVQDACVETPALYPRHNCGLRPLPWVLEQSGCGYRMELWLHGLGMYEGSRSPWDGSYCLELSEDRRPDCQQTEDRRWSCQLDAVTKCELELLEHTPAPPMVVARTRVYSATVAPNVTVPNLTGVALDVDQAQGGYISDLVVLDDKLVVSAHAGRLERPRCLAPSDVGELIFISQEGLQIIDRRPSHRCLMRLAREPGGDGFFGAFVQDQMWHLGQFDVAGGLVKSSSIAARTALETPGWIVADIVPGASGEIAVVVTSAARPDDLSTIVVVLDSDLRVLRRSRRFADNWVLAVEAVGASHVTSPHLLAAAPRSEAVYWFDLTSMEHVSFADPLGPRDDVVRSSPMALTMFDGHALAALAGTAGTVAFSDGFEWSGFESPQQLAGYPTAFAAWPPEPTLLATMVSRATEDSTFEANLMLLEPATKRFRSGAVTLGFGVASRPQVDAQGRLWTLLPWASEIVRITPQ